MEGRDAFHLKKGEKRLSLPPVIGEGRRRTAMESSCVEREIILNATTADSPGSLADLMHQPGMRVTLEGPALCGKSTMGVWIADKCCTALFGQPAVRFHETRSGEDAPLPVWIDLTVADPWNPNTMRPHDPRVTRDALETAIRRGHALILIDNVTCAAAEKVVRVFEAFPHNRYLCMALPCDIDDCAAASALQRYGAHRVRLAPLAPDRRRMLADRLIRQTRRNNPALDTHPLSVDEHVATFCGRMIAHADLYDLLAEPWVMPVAVQVDIEGHTLPAARPIVYQRALAALLKGDQERMMDIARFALAALECTREAPLPAISFSRDDWLRILAEACPDQDGERCANTLRRLVQMGFLVVDETTLPERRQWRLSRYGLQKFLAAYALAHTRMPHQTKILESTHDVWRETTALACWIQEQAPSDGNPAFASGKKRGTLFAALRRSIGRQKKETRSGRRLASRFTSLARPHVSAPIAPHKVHPVLLAGTLAEMLAARCPPRFLWDTRERLVQILSLPDADASLRVQAGFLLGSLGDPRFDRDMPLTVSVPEGTFLFGDGEAPWEEDRCIQRIVLPAFSIGVYPVTNGEYARFLQENPRCPKPRYWSDPRFNNPSCPVVGITWHEAAAYAAWLTSMIRDKLPPGMVVRLPLEIEWEKAATYGGRPDIQRRFPWGDVWKNDCANIAVTRTDSEGRARWATTPVGAFPAGASPYGVYDLIGNVWEWTASAVPMTSIRNDEENGNHCKDGTDGEYPDVAYILRGFAFNSSLNHIRATYRSCRLPPGFWRYNIGFRIVIAKPISASYAFHRRGTACP